ncbi:MAG TPA: CAP domain-containing protein, partial [Polyangiaceae bacterium]
ASSAAIDPIARAVPQGSAVTLRGRLRERYRDATVEVTRPDGSVTHVGDATGMAFDFAVALPDKGVHRVELLAHGAYGAEVLANFPIFVGIPEPPMVSEAAAGRSDSQPVDARAVENRLFVLLNEARRAAGVAPLTAHAGLTQVGELHSKDMVETGFLGHDSPRYGDPATRVHRGGLAFVVIAENVGRGATAEEVNAMLLESPGHRANALDPNLTEVGIGVVFDGRQGHPDIVATEEFGGVARSIDIGAAPGEVLRAINAEREKAGAKALVVDPLLAKAAVRGAERFVADAAPPQQDVVSSVNQELVRPVNGASPIGKRMRSAQSFLFEVISLDRTPKMERMLEPSARYVGVGVAQGNRPDTGPNTIAVVVVLGWPR